MDTIDANVQSTVAAQTPKSPARRSAGGSPVCRLALCAQGKSAWQTPCARQTGEDAWATRLTQR